MVEPFRRGLDLTAVEGRDIHVENLGAIERDLNLLPLHFDLLEIPFAHRAEISVLRPNTVVQGTVILRGLEAFLSGGGLLRVVAVAVDHLDFQTIFRRMSAERRAERDAIVAGRGQSELDADNAVFKFILGQEVPALAGLADDRAVLYFVAIEGTHPATQIFAVHLFHKSRVRSAAGEVPVGLVGRNFANEDIAPTDFAAVGLELNRPFRKRRIAHKAVRQFLLWLGCFGRSRRCVGQIASLLVRKEIFQHRVIHDLLTVEDDGDAFANHPDVKPIPLAKRPVHFFRGVFAEGAFAVVPQPPGALVLAKPTRIALRRVPDLHLRDPAQIDAAVTVGQRFVIHHQLKVAVIFIAGEIQALAVVDQFTLGHAPVGVDVFRSRLPHREAALDRLAFVVGELRRRHRPKLRGILGAPAIPAGQVLAVEECGESLWRRVLRRRSDRCEGEQE